MGRFFDIDIEPEALDRIIKTKNGAIIGTRLMESYAWKVGQNVSLSTLNNVAFQIVGVFKAGGSALETRAIAGRKFVQEALDKQGICNNIIVQVDDSENADAVIKFIDEKMNFPKKTHTKREKAFLAVIAEEMEDMLKFSRWIVLSTLLVILMGVSNTVSMSMKDRVQEVGVLRTLGFKRRTILGLVLSESALISLAGGLLAMPLVLVGLAVFKAFVGEISIRGIGITIGIDPGILVLSIPLGAAAGIIGGILPAFFSSRWKIVDCFRAVE